MCYSNCKNENYHGECSKRINKYDTDLHCFTGFLCEHCNEVFADDTQLSDFENTCVDCAADKFQCKHCAEILENSEMSNVQDVCQECDDECTLETIANYEDGKIMQGNL